MVFWVQLHNLPYSLLNTDTALSLGETLGTMTILKDLSEMRGSNFMRVRGEVDITNHYVEAEELRGIIRRKDGFVSSMNGFRIFIIGVVCYPMMIKIIYYGFRVKVHYR